jgi:hypothetical protein
MIEDFKKTYTDLLDCCLPAEARPIIEATTDVLYFIDSEPDGDAGAAVVRSEGGKFFAFSESQDYTGHGCRCGSDFQGPFDTLEAAILFGLVNETRRVLGLGDEAGSMT